MVMEFLYHGGCATLEVNQSDVLELMAAANFFQLDGLLRYCEAQCSTMVDLDNIVSMYIHAKVYSCSNINIVEKANALLNIALCFRYITRLSSWNTVKDSCCKIWWLF